jgi:MFS family permease
MDIVNWSLQSSLTSARRVDDGADRPMLSRIGVGLLLAGVFLPQVDFFIVNVALPTIGGAFHASAALLELIVAGYGAAYAAMLVLGGRLGDMYGRRRVYSLGLLGFICASLACGLAPGIWFLVGARIAQGGSAALIAPQVIATFHSALDGERRHRAQSLYSSAAGVAIVLGQLIGGLLVTADIAGTSWRPIFLVNVPIGLAVLIATQRFVPSTSSSHPASIDTAGTVLFAMTLVFLLVPLAEGRAVQWAWWTWVLLACVPFLGAATARAERRREAVGGVPLLPPSVMSLRSVKLGLALHFPFMLGYGAFMFVFALTIQKGLGAGPLGSGLAILPLAVPYFVGSLFVPKAIARFGARRVLAVAAGVQAVGFASLMLIALTWWPHLSIWAFSPGLMWVGLGQAFVFGSLFRVVLADVPERHAGVGGGVITTIQQGGLALGVATLATVFLSLESHGIGNAFATVGGVEAAIAVFIALGSRWIPRLYSAPRRLKRPQPRFLEAQPVAGQQEV